MRRFLIVSFIREFCHNVHYLKLQRRNNTQIKKWYLTYVFKWKELGNWIRITEKLRASVLTHGNRTWCLEYGVNCIFGCSLFGPEYKIGNRIRGSLHLNRSFATRVSQLKIWHFWVTGIERNVCKCTSNRYSIITQFAKLAAGEQLCRLCNHRKL
jgi:hypothetical protein